MLSVVVQASPRSSQQSPRLADAQEIHKNANIHHQAFPLVPLHFAPQAPAVAAVNTPHKHTTQTLCDTHTLHTHTPVCQGQQCQAPAARLNCQPGRQPHHRACCRLLATIQPCLESISIRRRADERAIQPVTNVDEEQQGQASEGRRQGQHKSTPTP